jgi:hypothetical protein
MNEFGVDKMSRNILALQQNLNNISLMYENQLDHARKFYELYKLGAKVNNFLRIQKRNNNNNNVIGNLEFYRGKWTGLFV